MRLVEGTELKKHCFLLSIVFLLSLSCVLDPSLKNEVCCQETNENIRVMWHKSLDDIIWASPIHIDNDGHKDIVLLGIKSIYLLSGKNGSVIWAKNVSYIEYTSLVVGKLTGNDKEFIVFMNGSDLCALYSRTGEPLWTLPLSNISEARPVLVDIDNDKLLEVIVVGTDRLYVIDGREGEVLWSKELKSAGTHSPAIGDINQDNDLEILLVVNDSLIALEGGAGEILWSYPIVPSIFSTPIIGNVNRDKNLEVIIYGSNALHVLDGSDGSFKWSFEIGSVSMVPAIGDVDGDVAHEIIVGNMYGSFYAIDSGGKILWEHTYAKMANIRASLSLADMNGNDRLDIIGIGYGGELCFVDGATGKMLSSYSIGDVVRDSPYLVDIDEDDDVEVIVCTIYGDIYALDVINAGYRIYWKGDIGDPLCRKNTLYLDGDYDGLSDSSERFIGSDPLDYDTDDDGMPDGWEVFYGLDLCQSSDGSLDYDNDGLSNYAEFSKGTNPLKSDTDGDFLADNIDLWSTDPHRPAIYVAYVFIIIIAVVVDYLYLKRKGRGSRA